MTSIDASKFDDRLKKLGLPHDAFDRPGCSRLFAFHDYHGFAKLVQMPRLKKAEPSSLANRVSVINTLASRVISTFMTEGAEDSEGFFNAFMRETDNGRSSWRIATEFGLRPVSASAQWTDVTINFETDLSIPENFRLPMRTPGYAPEGTGRLRMFTVRPPSTSSTSSDTIYEEVEAPRRTLCCGLIKY